MDICMQPGTTVGVGILAMLDMMPAGTAIATSVEVRVISKLDYKKYKRGFVHFLFDRPGTKDYTRVFFVIDTDQLFGRIPNFITEWQNSAHHDSWMVIQHDGIDRPLQQCAHALLAQLNGKQADYTSEASWQFYSPRVAKLYNVKKVSKSEDDFRYKLKYHLSKS